MRQNDPSNAPASTRLTEQYLTFELDREHYGIEILRVQEIKGWAPVTAIPNSPPWFKGVMNLRGTVVPVVDLRLKLGLEQVEYNRFTVVIVVNVSGRVVGLVVDAVSDVLDVPTRDLVAPPDIGSATDTHVLAGMAKSNDRLVSLLDLERAVGEGTLETVTR